MPALLERLCDPTQVLDVRLSPRRLDPQTPEAVDVQKSALV
jgi:hypothetical protein